MLIEVVHVFGLDVGVERPIRDARLDAGHYTTGGSEQCADDRSHLEAYGAAAPLTTVLLGLNILIGLSLLFFWRVSRCGDARLHAERDRSVVAH